MVAALLVKKFFRRLITLFTEGENNWIRRGAGLIQSTHCSYLQKVNFYSKLEVLLGVTILEGLLQLLDRLDMFMFY